MCEDGPGEKLQGRRWVYFKNVARKGGTVMQIRLIAASR